MNTSAVPNLAWMPGEAKAKAPALSSRPKAESCPSMTCRIAARSAALGAPFGLSPCAAAQKAQRQSKIEDDQIRQPRAAIRNALLGTASAPRAAAKCGHSCTTACRKSVSRIALAVKIAERKLRRGRIHPLRVRAAQARDGRSRSD